MITRNEGATLPDLSHSVNDANGGLYDFSSGWTFSIEIKNKKKLLTKTTGITGYRTDPNVLVVVGTSDIASLEPGFYTYKLTPTSPTGKTLTYSDTLYIKPV